MHDSDTCVMTSLVPANDLVEQRLEQSSLVGDGVLTDVNADLLQRLLDDGWNLPTVRCKWDKEKQPVITEDWADKGSSSVSSNVHYTPQYEHVLEDFAIFRGLKCKVWPKGGNRKGYRVIRNLKSSSSEEHEYIQKILRNGNRLASRFWYLLQWKLWPDEGSTGDADFMKIWSKYLVWWSFQAFHSNAALMQLTVIRGADLPTKSWGIILYADI